MRFRRAPISICAPNRQPSRPVARRSRAVPTAASPWWAPDVHADRRPVPAGAQPDHGRRRAPGSRARDFVEVETPALQVSPGNEAHLHAFATEAIEPDGARAPLYLHTSPEFACKKLLAAGEPRIFDSPASGATASAGRCTIPNSPCWNGTAPASPTRALMDDCAELAGAAPPRPPARRRFSFRGRDGRSVRRAGAADAWPRRSTRFAGIDLLATVDADGETDRDALLPPRRRAAASASPPTTPGPTCSAACWWRRSSPSSASAARPSSANTRSREAALARAERRRSARRRTVRALCLRRRAGQRLRRAHRPAEQRRRFEARDGREAARLRRALSDRRGLPGRAGGHAARPAASRSASTGW